MTQRDWKRGDAHALGVFLNGERLQDADHRGQPLRDSSFLVLFNAHYEDVEFRLPNVSYGRRWSLELSTEQPELEPGSTRWEARGAVPVTARSMMLLERIQEQAPGGMSEQRELRGTYRLQLGPGLRLRRGARARSLHPRAGRQPPLPLPLMQARAGSTHGYDVVDPDARLAPSWVVRRSSRTLAQAGCH